ncbi:hypothetical protein QYE76_053407 [Lolium multiflorum]|uniref:Transposase (putative) gypsy type domain-containing protein n=1 Tax=Lolium multiflorum TaxID=4521 RepID=A0AAD8SVN4_LOLMU|nr:hypothetical protein QYE76_053407 [Lolium multiflorum]
MEIIIALVDRTLVMMILAPTQGAENSIAMLVLMNVRNKNKLFTKIVIKRLAMPTMGMTTNPKTTSSTTWTRHLIVKPMWMLKTKVIKIHQGVTSGTILAMTKGAEDNLNMIKMREPTLDNANNLVKIRNNILNMSQVKLVFTHNANPMLWLVVEDLLYHLKSQEMKASVLAEGTWKMKRPMVGAKCRGIVMTYAIGWLIEVVPSGLTVVSGCGYGHERHGDVPRFEALRWRIWGRVDFIVRLRLGCTGNSAASSPAPDLTVLTASSAWPFRMVTSLSPPDPVRSWGSGATVSGNRSGRGGSYGRSKSRRGPRSPRGHATGAPGGYKCPPRGTEAAFFFLSPLPLLSLRALFARHCFFSGDLLANPGDPTRPEFSAVRQLPARQAGATGPRGSTLRSSPPRSPPVRSGSSSPFDLSWSSSSSSSTMASASGSWRGSYMHDDDIERLVRLRRIPREVITRTPGEEVEPKPEPGERVVFGAHLDRGLGLPASAFFRRFLEFFGLQPHHLPANACVLLSCYVAFMEGYAGLWPDVDFWSRLFYLKSQMTEGRLRTCGAASIYPRAGSLFPKIPTVDSVKNWQMSFFYVKNANPAFDRINLPEYNPAPPTTRLNWGHNAKSADPDAEVNLLWDFLGECVTGGRLSAEDLLCTYMERRVIPLQGRVHKIGHMSGRLDSTRTSRVALTKAQVAHRVNNITKANMPEDWAWGLPPYDRAAPPERIFPRQEIEDGDLAHKIWTADLVDPADQAGDQAGDDDLPVVPDQGGQGEHNPPPSPEQREEEEVEPATSTTGPIRAVPLRTRPPAASATSAPKKKKRAAGGSTARLEGQAKRQRQQGPKKVPEMAGAAIKLPRAVPLGRLLVLRRRRRQREPTPPSTLARTPPVVVVPPVARRLPRGYLFACAPPPGQGAQGESAQRPTLGDLFPHRAPLLGPTAGAGRGVPPAAGAGAGGAAPPERPGVVPTGPAAPPPASEPPRAEPAGKGPQREEPARAKDADSRALVRSKGPAVSPTSLHVAKGARLVSVPSASDSSFGSAGTMEQAWNQADSCEIISREGQPGTAPLKMLFSGYRASLKNKAAEVMAQLSTLEDADKVDERRTVLYNKVVTSYHKAKIERGTLARELEAVKVEAAKVPQLERDLRVARAQCAESEEAGRAAAAKLKVADGETAEKEKVDDLSRRLDEVEKQRLALQKEVTAKSTELTATAKHWTDLIGAIDRGFSAFPETQAAALAAVGDAREARGRATGEGSSECFTMEDYMSSLAARVEPITKFGWELRKAAEELVPMLWPGEAAPQDISSLTSLIEQAPDRFIDWKGSATRAGADMALSFVLSWYNEVDLGQLEYRRAGVEEELSAEQKAARLARASAIADFVDKRLFIADPNPHSDEEEELEDEGVEMDSPPPAVDPAGPTPAGA